MSLLGSYFRRALLHDFFCSARQVLSPDGEIHVSLCEGQGGSPAKTMDEWRDSWNAALYAAECGLLLKNVLPYEVSDLLLHN